MQLTEIKNDLATINYSPELNRLMLSDFILVEDTNQSILAQVVSIEATMDENVNSAMIKFLLSIDKDANLTQYTGYVPAKSASLILINPQEVVQLIKGNDKNLHIGNLVSYPDIPVEISIDFLRKKPYIQVDFAENKLYLVEAMLRGLEKHNKKTILLDFFGLYSRISLPTVTIGYNFKLPLNYDALCYIAEEELNDCTNDNKAILQGILIEVQNYVKGTEDGFIPFDTLISVLDAQYNESPMPELLLLKNKLLKYQQQGLFAQEKSEFDFLDTFLKDAKNFKFDLSELPISWHKIAFVSILNIIKAKCYLITDFSDENSSKSIIKKLYEKSEIKPIVISSYQYKYQLQLKALSKNLILFKPLQKVNDFAGYTSFLNILSQDNFIVWGEQTLFIPLIIKLQTSTFNDVHISKKIETPKKEKLEVKEEEPIYTETTSEPQAEETDIEQYDFTSDDNQPEIEETYEETSEINEPEIVEPETTSFEIQENIEEQTPVISEPEVAEVPQNTTIPEVQEITQEPEVIENILEDNIQSEEDAIPEDEDLDFFFDQNEITQEETVTAQSFEEETTETEEIEETVENIEDINLNENLVEEPAIIEETEPQPIQEEQTTVNPDSFINDEVAEEPQEEQTPQVPQTEPELKSSTIPVYKSNVAPQIDTKFAQGTYVHHPKYGRGVVEKIMNYGTKSLCSIIFDDVGRRLLDPNVAGLEQI